jgi:hypothetical protein
VDWQLNEFVAMLILRTAKWRAQTDPSLGEAARHMKEGLKESDLLSLVTVKGLTSKHKILVTLFKLHLYGPAMLLCAGKVKQQRMQGK